MKKEVQGRWGRVGMYIIICGVKSRRHLLLITINVENEMFKRCRVAASHPAQLTLANGLRPARPFAEAPNGTSYQLTYT